MKLDTFFDNFGLLADALNGVQKLREMVLQLAVQGKLISQDSKDEPASVLLEKIKTTKERLIKEKKIKKPKPLTPIKPSQFPYKLPVGWEWARFSDAIVLKHGHQFRKYDFVPEGIPVVKIGQCKEDGSLELSTCDYIDPAREKEFEDFKIYKDDLLMALTGGTLGKVTRVDKDYDVVVQNYRVGKFIPIGGLFNKDFCTIILKSNLFQSLVQTSVNQNAQPNIGKEKIELLLIPCPPLNEQKRIVAKVDELMALCDELEARKKQVSKNCIQLNDVSIHKLLTAREPKKFSKHWQRICDNFDLLYSRPETVTKLRQAILQLAVQGKLVPQDPKDEPASILLEKIKTERERLIKEKKIKKGKPLQKIGEDEKQFFLSSPWTWVRLKEIVFLLGDGIHGTPNYTSGTEYYFINGNNLDDGEIVIRPNTKTVSLYELEKHRKNLTRNTVLVSINGTLGRVAFYNDEKIMLGKSVCYFNLPYGIRKHYIKIVIESPYFIKYAYDNATGSTIKNLSLKAMNNFPVPLPPINEQKRIVAKVAQLMALCNELESNLSKSQTDCDRLMEAAVAEILAA